MGAGGKPALARWEVQVKISSGTPHFQLKLWAVLAVALHMASAAHADVRLSLVFSDHMVLQRNKPVPVFGTAEI